MIIHCDCNNRFEFRPCCNWWFTMHEVPWSFAHFSQGHGPNHDLHFQGRPEKLGWWQWTLQSAFWFSTGPKKTPPHLTDMFSKKKHVEKKNMSMASTSVTWKTEFNKCPPRPLQSKLVTWSWSFWKSHPPVAPKAFVAFFQYRDDADGQRFVEGGLGGGGEVSEDSEATLLALLHPTSSWVL